RIRLEAAMPSGRADGGAAAIVGSSRRATLRPTNRLSGAGIGMMLAANGSPDTAASRHKNAKPLTPARRSHTVVAASAVPACAANWERLLRDRKAAATGA